MPNSQHANSKRPDSQGSDFQYNDYVLYGMQASLYTGKVRAYMRRNRIPVTERGPGHAEYAAKIMPTIGRFIIPVIQAPTGEIIQDGTDISDYLERSGQETGARCEPLYPEDPVIKALAFLFELFGNEGLLRPAMHYRWNFDADNLDYLKVSFADVFPAGLDIAAQAQMFDHASGRMRKVGTAFGVTPDTVATIETSYADFLSRLNDHFSRSYFLFGDHPTIGDYGLFNPLYAHLARDPKPAFIMKSTAPYVWNWVERMNAPERQDRHTLKEAPKGLVTLATLPDALSHSLTALMRYISEEYLAEMTAHIDYTNSWLAEQGDAVEAGQAMKARSIGFAAFHWRGHDIKTAVTPYRFYLLQRLQDHVASVSAEDQAAIRTMFADTGLTPLLDNQVARRVMRRGHHEMWADAG